MAEAQPTELKGFDSYELKLGDILRGERASKGKSLLDVQRDLRIRAAYISAIEDADVSVFPNDGFAAGYIRSYAKYLDLDADDVYRQFCEESEFGGFAPEVSVEPTLSGEAKPVSPGRKLDDIVVETRFTPHNTREARLDFGASLRGAASVMVLLAIVGGLGFGGWTVLQNLQRVGFAPLPEAPEVAATAPDILAPAQDSEVRPALAGADDARLTLAALYAEQEVAAPQFVPRDGPIAAIDPARSGVFASPAIVSTPEVIITDTPPPPSGAEVDQAAAETPPSTLDETETAAASETPAPDLDLAPRGVNVWAKAEAWVRVTDGAGKTLFTGILAPGDSFSLPEGAAGAKLRAGNAGSVFLTVDDSIYGPLGDGPTVAKNVTLAPDEIRESYPLVGKAAPNRKPADTREAMAAIPGE